MERGKQRIVWDLLWNHVRPFRWLVVAVFLLGTFTTFAQQGATALIMPVWEVLFPDTAPMVEVAPESAGRFQAWMAEVKQDFRDLVLGDELPQPGETDKQKSLLFRVCKIIVVMALFAAAAKYVLVVLGQWIALQVQVSLRRKLAKHLMSLSLRYHGERKLGDLLSRISQDVQRAMTVVQLSLRELVLQPLRLVVALGFAFWMNWQLSLLVLVGLPILILPVAKILRRVRKKSTESLQDFGASVQALSQMFQGVRTVKAFNAEERELDRYNEANLRYVGTAMKMARASALSQTWTLLYTHIGLAVMLVALGMFALNTNDAELAPFFLFISEAYSAVKTTTRAWGQVAESAGACERLNDLFEEKTEIVEAPGATTLTGLGSGIRFEGLSFAYPGGEGNALSNINLEVRPGETLALVGASGSGKSTMLDLVARFIDPTEGRISVDGVDLKGATLDSWSARFSMVTQVPFLFHDSVGENIRYGRPGASDDEVKEAAKAANIWSLIERMPEGLDTDVNDFGSRLSGGERQRITIARAILHGGELLLLDEATSALDTESEAVVQAALDELMEDRTVIVIAHRLSTVRDADRIAVLDGGELVELGSHEALLAEDGVYAKLHALQFRSEENGGA